MQWPRSAASCMRRDSSNKTLLAARQRGIRTRYVQVSAGLVDELWFASAYVAAHLAYVRRHAVGGQGVEGVRKPKRERKISKVYVALLFIRTHRTRVHG